MTLPFILPATLGSDAGQFRVVGDWSLEGYIQATVYFVPDDEGFATTGHIVNGFLDVSVPVINGSYLVKFCNVSCESRSTNMSGWIAPFRLHSGGIGSQVDLFDVTSPHVQTRSIYQ